MNHGCMVMTRKQSSSVRNAIRRPLGDRKNAPSLQQHQVNADNFFLAFEELCIRSLFHLVRLSMEIFTARFWDDLGKMWGANGLRCGRTETGCCTMTMRLHTPRSLWGNSWQKITQPLFPTVPAHLTWPPAISTCSLKWNSGWKGGASYPLKRSKQNRNRYCTKHANAGRLQWVLPKITKSLRSLYTSPRWLLRRWRWKLGLKVSIHIITSKFSEILGSA